MKKCPICKLDKDGTFLTGCFSDHGMKAQPADAVYQGTNGVTFKSGDLWPCQFYGDKGSDAGRTVPLFVPDGYRIMGPNEIPEAGDRLMWLKNFRSSLISGKNVDDWGSVEEGDFSKSLGASPTFHPWIRKV